MFLKCFNYDSLFFLLEEIYGHGEITGKNISNEQLEVCLSVCLFASLESILRENMLIETTFQYFINLHNLPLNTKNNLYIMQMFLKGT